MRPSRSVLIVASLAIVTAGCGSEDESARPGATGTATTESRSPRLPRGSEPVQLDPANFVSRIDNPYWPMAPRTKWVYRERDAEGSTQRVEVTVTDRGKTILGIRATVVHDVVTENGKLKEDTFDWYAQDKWGNLWYLGEDTKEYENGKVVSREGSWEAGVDGAQAGVILPGSPEVGLAYRQEYYAGEAEDSGEILSLSEQVDVPYGRFDGALMTKDTNRLEPDVVEHKFYVKGIGPVLAVGVSGGASREELVRLVRRGN